MRERPFHNALKEVTTTYGYAWSDYKRAMRDGDTDKADDALSRMQEIEQRVTIIERPAR